MNQIMNTPRDKKYYEYIFPLLQVMQRNNSSTILATKEIINGVITFLKIPEHCLQETYPKSGMGIVEHRLSWALNNAKRGGYVEQPQRAFYTLTEKGKDVKNENDLNQFWIKLLEQDQLNNKLKKENQAKFMETYPNTKEEEESGTLSNSEAQWQDTFIAKLLELSPTGFEKFCVDLIKATGVEQIEHTGQPNDKGIDAIGYLTADNFLTHKLGFQFKRYENSTVPSKDIRNLLGSLELSKCDRGIFITTSSFTKEAKKQALAMGTKITLIDRDALCELATKSAIFLEPFTAYNVKHQQFDKYE